MLPIELLQQIQTELPFRSSELNILDAMLHLDIIPDDLAEQYREVSTTRSPAIVIYGPRQSGKSSIMKSLLTSSNEHNHTLIDCKTCVTARSLYERCMNEMLRRKLSVDEHGDLIHTFTSVETLDAFINSLSHILKDTKAQNPVLVSSPCLDIMQIR